MSNDNKFPFKNINFLTPNPRAGLPSAQAFNHHQLFICNELNLDRLPFVNTPATTLSFLIHIRASSKEIHITNRAQDCWV
jgi:hypothetical protein